MKSLSIVLLAGALALALACADRPARAQGRAPAVGEPAPDFSLRSPEGKVFRLSELTRSKVVLVNFAWLGAPPSRQELSHLQKVYQEFAPKGLEILSVASFDEVAEIQAFWRERGLRFPVVMDREETINKAYRVTDVPWSYLVGRDGRIVAAWGGFVPETSPELIRRELAKANLRAAARVYDAAADFSPTRNPNGPWSYGYLAPGREPDQATFQPFTERHRMEEGIDVWRVPGVIVPSVAHNPGAGEARSVGVTWGPKQLSVHPGLQGHYGTVRWTAPETGSYAIEVTFTGIDAAHPTTTDVHVLYHGHSLLLNEQIRGAGPTSAKSRTASVAVKKGEPLDFCAGWGADGTCTGDTTGLSVRIRPYGEEVPRRTAGDAEVLNASLALLNGPIRQGSLAARDLRALWTFNRTGKLEYPGGGAVDAGKAGLIRRLAPSFYAMALPPDVKANRPELLPGDLLVHAPEGDAGGLVVVRQNRPELAGGDVILMLEEDRKVLELPGWRLSVSPPEESQWIVRPSLYWLRPLDARFTAG